MLTAYQLRLRDPIGSRSISSLDLLRWSERIIATQRRNRASVRQCLLVGILFDGGVIGLCVAAAVMVPKLSMHEPRPRVGLIISGAVCFWMLLIAACTKPASRGETASRIVREGFHAAARSGDIATGMAAAILMVMALYGSYCIVESAWRFHARRKLAAVDRCELARILAKVMATPTGVPLRMLLRHGESVDALRLPVAALILDGWVVLRERGRVLEQRAPSDLRHGWKHPLAEIFRPAPAGFFTES